MKKHYVATVVPTEKFDTQPAARAAGELIARRHPGTTVAVYQVKEVFHVNTAQVTEIPLEN